MEIPVSDLIVRYLERLGVEVIFGMPGAHVLPIYDGLYRSSIRTVLAKHEQGASFMAGGYTRLSHKVGACIATAGPGATNLITGIANAYAEKQPVIAITGETSTYIFGRGGLQESAGEGAAIEQTELFRGITRYRKLIERTDYLAQVLNQATQALKANQAGPVLLSVPFNVQREPVDEGLLDQVHFPQASAVCASQAGPLVEFAALVAQARHPVIVAGYGCIKADARALVARLSEDLGIPVATSLKGKGVVAEGSPLALGSLGVTSNGEARRYIVEHADLLIFLGAGFNERTSYLWSKEVLAGKRIAQIDRDPTQLGRVFKPDLAIHGDIREVLTELLAQLHQDGVPPRSLEALQRHRELAAGGGAGGVSAAPDERFAVMAAFFAALARHFPHDAVVFDDNIVFAQSYFEVSDSSHYFPNTGISSLGYAIPAAVGAGMCAKGAPLFAVIGDGGFQMCCMEIMTAVNYEVPLNVVVINNSTMGLIRKNQFQLYGERYIDCDFVNPDFRLMADAFGIAHHRIETVDQVEALFASVDLRGTINLIEILLDKNAFPTYLSSR